MRRLFQLIADKLTAGRSAIGRPVVTPCGREGVIIAVSKVNGKVMAKVRLDQV
jgi:hypothetical protein